MDPKQLFVVLQVGMLEVESNEVTRVEIIGNIDLSLNPPLSAIGRILDRALCLPSFDIIF